MAWLCEVDTFPNPVYSCETVVHIKSITLWICIPRTIPPIFWCIIFVDFDEELKKTNTKLIEYMFYKPFHTNNNKKYFNDNIQNRQIYQWMYRYNYLTCMSYKFFFQANYSKEFHSHLIEWHKKKFGQNSGRLLYFWSTYCDFIISETFLLALISWWGVLFFRLKFNNNIRFHFVSTKDDVKVNKK